MDDEEILDPFNELDLAALHYVFLPLINDKIDACRQVWSKHRMQTIKTFPIRLWVSGQMNSTPDDDVGPEQLLHYDVEGVVGGDGNKIVDNDGPIFCSFTEKVLTDGVLSASQREVSFHSRSKPLLRCIMLSNIMNVANNGLKGNAQFLFSYIPQNETLYEQTIHLPK